MMKKIIASALLIVAVAAAGPLQAGVQEAKNPAAEKYAAPLKKIFDYQKIFAPLDPALEKVYPVAIVEGKTFYVFEPVPDQKVYRLALTAPDTFNVPVGVRA